jgi:hypothetical protein
MRKAWLSLLFAAGLFIGGVVALEYTCQGQCAHHTARGKRCQDRCFKKGMCPNANADQ